MRNNKFIFQLLLIHTRTRLVFFSKQNQNLDDIFGKVESVNGI